MTDRSMLALLLLAASACFSPVGTIEEESATSATAIGTSPTSEPNRKFDQAVGRDAAVNQSVHTKLEDSKAPSEVANKLEVKGTYWWLQSWYQDATQLAAIASVGAVFISVFALIISHLGADDNVFSWVYYRGETLGAALQADDVDDRINQNSAADAWRQACEDNGLNPYIDEAYEHWIVSRWFAERLAEKGER